MMMIKVIIGIVILDARLMMIIMMIDNVKRGQKAIEMKLYSLVNNMKQD